MSIASLIKRMRELGAPMEAIELAVAAVEEVEAKFIAAEDARKKGQRERTAKHRAMSRDSNVTVTSQQRDPSPKENNQTPTQEISPSDPKGSSAPKGVRTTRKGRNHALPDAWEPGPVSEAECRELGRSSRWMFETAKDLRIWANGGGHVRKDWDLVHVGWMRREVKREAERPATRASPSGDRPSNHVALDRLSRNLGMSDEQPRAPSRFNGHGSVIDHAGDGSQDRGLFEPLRGDAGQPSPQANLRVVGSRWG